MEFISFKDTFTFKNEDYKEERKGTYFRPTCWVNIMLHGQKLFNYPQMVFPVSSPKTVSKVNIRYSHVKKKKSKKNFINIKQCEVCLFKDSLSYLSKYFLCVCDKK